MKKKILLPAILISLSYADIVENVLNKFSNSSQEESKKLTPKALKEKRFNEIWSKIKDKLVEGTKLYSTKESAPDKTFVFGKDKQDIQDDIDSVLNEIVNTLIDDDILKYKQDIEQLNKDIQRDYEKISEYKEEKIGAPSKSYIHTTISQYEIKIKNTQDEIKIFKNKIRIIKKSLKEQFKQIGIRLNAKQIDVLLSRVDGNDIIQMSVVIDVLKQITNQIIVLMKSSNEDLTQAKRYYGMHLVTIALIANVYQKYIDKVDNIYLPKLKKLTSRAEKLIRDTQIAIDSEASDSRKTVYISNLKAQELTYKVALMYKENLLESKKKVADALEIAKKNLELAENTYNTVALSKGIYDLISESKAMFNKISQIQMPDIMPFENKQIEIKYKELTKKLLEY